MGEYNPAAAAESSFANPQLLEKIDKLFACNVGEHVALPQLVVVGDQSSGKSSVLEGLTNIAFPRASELCTRFATQITFRRSELRSITVSILPTANASDDHSAKCRAYKRTVEELDAKEFTDIMKEVQSVMGIRVDLGTTGSTTSAFSGDVLKLEVCGPEQPHMSVIDVPGIFKRTTQGLTTKADIELVRAMVLEYMKNPRSVMLTVIPANVDIATQEILEMAEEVDKNGHRTLGVLTKPDLVDRGAERSVIDLLQGRRQNLTLGWHVVRNPSQHELSGGEFTEDRNAVESGFFRNDPRWNKLEKDKVGIVALRNRLQEVLGAHIRREFPKVKAEISKLLKTCNEQLDDLGLARDTPSEQSKYVMGVATKYWRLVDDALCARYNDNYFTDNRAARLATKVVQRNETFARTMVVLGHSYDFDSEPVGGANSNGDGDYTKARQSRKSAIDSIRKQLKDDVSFKVHDLNAHDDLEEILQSPTTVVKPVEGKMLGWLSEVYDNSRGFELGTYDSKILASTMREQSANWEHIAHGYINDIATMVHEFICDVLKHLCPDERLCEGLKSLLMEELLARYKIAVDKVRFLLKVERAGTPSTLNHYFNENLEKCRQHRIQRDLTEKAFTLHNSGQHSKVVRLDDIKTTQSKSNAEHMVQDIHDTLKSYYKLARKRFVDNVVMQATDFHLLNGDDTPLDLFSPDFVNALSVDQLEDIAGEDIVLRRKRAVLKKQKADLEAGRKILI